MSELIGLTGSVGKTCTCLSLDATSHDEIAAQWFRECLFSWEERMSFYIGMTSLVFWIMCQLPQFVKNYKQKSAEGLAGLLLIQWLCGDMTNLIGSILTRQLAFQKLSAGLFVFMDVSMITQKALYASNDLKASTKTIRNSNASITHHVVVVVMIVAYLAIQPAHALEDELVLIPSCEPEAAVEHQTAAIGNILGWVSSCFYVGSRVAQITKNRERQSTEGVASTMFVFAILGNLTYSIGILLRSDHLVKALPWLTGSLTCMSLDIFIVSQTRYYERLEREARRMASPPTPEHSVRQSLLSPTWDRASEVNASES